MKKLIMLLIILSSLGNVYAQIKYFEMAPLSYNEEYINKTDSLCRRTGLWVEYLEDKEGFIYSIRETYYKEGKRNGTIKEFGISRTNPNLLSLQRLAYYKDDKPYLFEYLIDPDTGYWEMTKVNDNVDFRYTPKNYVEPGIFTYQCYTREYDKYGVLRREGWLVFEDDGELDSTEVGDWKIYDENGDYTIKNYDGPPAIDNFDYGR